MSADEEIDGGERFGFGANWARFLSVLDDERIAEAEASLSEMLSVTSLEGKTFLDIGCGSGLFSLAARRLGATVHSFDFDPRSVACAKELKHRYFDGDGSWLIEQGSTLDRDYMEALGQFDVVYSWGVLHHTGAMWTAIDDATRRVADAEGRLYIAIYNDQGWKSHIWWLVKAFYNRLPHFLQRAFVTVVISLMHVLLVAKYTFKLKPMTGIRSLLKDRQVRGMSAKYDNVDWIGGFPYEFASFETIKDYVEARGFSLINARRTTSWGCNEFAFRRDACAD